MHASPLIDNVDMYKYAKFYQNIPCGSRVISVFANCRLTDGRTHTVIITLEPLGLFGSKFVYLCILTLSSEWYAKR